ncbi:MAG TPA: C4-type zinc ribbon domain-containing protein [Myxococcota bacterium]|nr:C4-type zinc ribbon domain-containing protein [Myxococcota bacterium]HQK50563.1 C4-type zinc ribbon domain-containing protein [Myxococcota bacterium]
MKSLINALRALQNVDRQRIEVERERQSITERVDHLAAMVSDLERELEDKREKLKEAERWYKEREREAREDNEKVKRLQSRLNAVAKAKEYAAIQREIEIIRRGNAQREEEIQKLRAVMEEFGKAVEEEEAKLREMREELVREREATEARVRRLDERIGELAVEHQAFEKGIPTEVLSRYRRLQKALMGLAVVPVRSNESCGGCHRKLPPQLYNTLLRGDSLQACPYCSRFLYLEEEGD